MELSFELLAVCCIFEEESFGDLLLSLSREAVGLGFEANAFGFFLLSLSREAVGLGFEANAFGFFLLSLRRDAVSLRVEAETLGLAADAGEFGLHLDPRRLLLDEGHRLFQPAVVICCGCDVHRCTDECDRVSILLTQRSHRNDTCAWFG